MVIVRVMCILHEYIPVRVPTCIARTRDQCGADGSGCGTSNKPVGVSYDLRLTERGGV